MNPGETNFDDIKRGIRARVTGFYRGLVLEAHRRVVLRTPVLTGRTRANWMLTSGAPSQETVDAVDPTGSKTIQEGAQVIERIELTEPVYIVNNLPHVQTLDLGGYPDPVKRGTYMGPGRGYEIRSEGGFSKQAPQGMVRVTIEEIRQLAELQARGVSDPGAQ